jgi:hypothetical protein
LDEKAGVASTCWNVAGVTSTETPDTVRSSWKSKENSERFCVARAVIVVPVPFANEFVAGS